MTTTTRIFGDALRNFEQEKPFKISVSNLNTGSHQNVGKLEKEELVSPLDFIENLRRDNHLSEDEAYLAVAELPTREKNVFSNAAYVFTVFAAAVVAAAVVVEVLGSDRETINFYKKLNSSFLKQLSDEAMRQGGVTYFKQVMEVYSEKVKQYNGLNNVNV